MQFTVPCVLPSMPDGRPGRDVDGCLRGYLELQEWGLHVWHKERWIGPFRRHHRLGQRERHCPLLACEKQLGAALCVRALTQLPRLYCVTTAAATATAYSSSSAADRSRITCVTAGGMDGFFKVGQNECGIMNGVHMSDPKPTAEQLAVRSSHAHTIVFSLPP